MITPELNDAIDAVRSYTDLLPWYWYSYGEKCYAFAVVEAYPENEGDSYPRPGSRLEIHPTKEWMLVGDNGTAMIVESEIASIEEQRGDTICRFIAEAHAALVDPNDE